MSRLSEFAVGKRSVILLLAAALFVAGFGAWGSLKQELLPDIQLPILTVIVPFPGSGAADVAEQVTKPVERTIGSVPGLKTLQSTSANSIALVIAQFDYGTDVKAARTQIEQNLQGAGLPASATPQVAAVDINASPVIIASISATSQTGLADAARIAQTEISPELLGLAGVAKVDITGGLADRIQITLDPAKLTANGVTASQVSGVLGANNLTFPAGQITADGSKIPVSTIGVIGSLDEIKALVVGYKVAAPAPANPSASPSASSAPPPPPPPRTHAPPPPPPPPQPPPPPPPPRLEHTAPRRAGRAPPPRPPRSPSPISARSSSSASPRPAMPAPTASRRCRSRCPRRRPPTRSRSRPP